MKALPFLIFILCFPIITLAEDDPVVRDHRDESLKNIKMETKPRTIKTNQTTDDVSLLHAELDKKTQPKTKPESKLKKTRPDVKNDQILEQKKKNQRK